MKIINRKVYLLKMVLIIFVTKQINTMDNIYKLYFLRKLYTYIFLYLNIEVNNNKNPIFIAKSAMLNIGKFMNFNCIKSTT